jgi:hypothetical protein
VPQLQPEDPKTTPAGESPAANGLLEEALQVIQQAIPLALDPLVGAGKGESCSSALVGNRPPSDSGELAALP